MRLFLLALTLAAFCFADAPAAIRGKLTQRAGQPPAIETPDRKLIALDGDAATLGVLNDKRLAGAGLNLKGHFSGADRFVVDPIHTKAMLVHKNGKTYRITYWCDVCAIRTYS
ncbi:MAG: hypothetical protein M3Z85_12135, partial [Acidobacteriota bacterium]|nr:hypothetical protein [Acidobacteriota bacterium]